MNTIKFFSKIIFLCVALSASQAVLAFKCGSKIIDRGLSKGEVLLKCGEPDWSTRWHEGYVGSDDITDRPSVYSEHEMWLYNRGSQRLLQFLIFRDGRLDEIRSGGYGFNEHGSARCDPREIREGLTSVEILARCGLPVFRDQRYDELIEETQGNVLKRTITVDEWLYNFGPNKFVRILTFKNGVLHRIEMGDRGQ